MSGKSQLRIAGDSDQPMPRRFNFTKTALSALTCPAGKERAYVYDQDVKGLALALMATGAKVFYFARRMKNGKYERIRLGDFPGLSVDNARTLAKQKTGDVANGVDLMAELRAERAEAQRLAATIMLAELYEKYDADHSTLRNSKHSRETDKSRMKTCFGDWTGRKINTITPEAVQAKHIEIARAKSPTTANRAVQLLRRLLNFAKLKPNPAANPDKQSRNVEWFDENKRIRYVTADELPALMASINVEQQPFPDFFKVSLYTGARRGNVCSMRWDEIDSDSRLWIIPADKAKAKDPITIPLSTPAVDILARRKAERDRTAAAAKVQPSPWVFPSPDSASGHIVEPRFAWERILKRAKIVDLHIHDLRHTQATWMANLNVSPEAIGKMLGHRRPETTKRYMHMQNAAVRAGTELAADAMRKAIDAGKPADPDFDPLSLGM